MVRMYTQHNVPVVASRGSWFAHVLMTSCCRPLSKPWSEREREGEAT